ncbi:MAG: TetR/AcrR family transcriptional regulator [Actinomycetes bacterium]
MKIFHPSKEIMVRCVINLTKTQGIETITSDQVHKISGISKGSMYHHFKDFDELIEVAESVIYASVVDDVISRLSTALSISKSREDFLTAIAAITYGNQTPEKVEDRLSRITYLAQAISSERMKLSMGAEQERLTQGIADLIREAQERGWANPNLNALAASIFLQAFTVGRVIDYISDERVDDESWIFLIAQVVDRVIFAPV